jgi:hypothetical protein
VKKERVGLEGSRMGTKENDFKSGKTVFIGTRRKKKKLEHTVIQKYFFLEIPINVKAGRVKRAPGKFIAGAVLDRPAVYHSPILRSLGNKIGCYSGDRCWLLNN